jgi:hypothetical protein
MHLKGIITACCLAVSAAVPAADSFETGRVIREVRCRRSPDFSYMLYLPSVYAAEREVNWPVLFVMGPDGGTEEGIRRYIRGAELNRWIVVMSNEAKDGFESSRQAVAAMVNDVAARFPVDQRRCYAGGMGSGARLAFWLANAQPKMIIGILPCGAGDAGNRYETQALAYGLCGARCFTRWDMAVTFNEHIRFRGRLRFFPGGHEWADENLCFDAMTWLNGKYLAEEGVREEVSRFSDKLFRMLLQRYETDPYFTYENALVLAEVEKAPHADQAREIAEQFVRDPRFEGYLDARSDMDKFVEKHFNTDPADFRRNRLTRRQKEKADELLEQYADTPLAPVFRDFGLPAVMP